MNKDLFDLLITAWMELVLNGLAIEMWRSLVFALWNCCELVPQKNPDVSAGILFRFCEYYSAFLEQQDPVVPVLEEHPSDFLLFFFLRSFFSFFSFFVTSVFTPFASAVVAVAIVPTNKVKESTKNIFFISVDL